MKILSVPQIREADAYTIAQEPIASIDLMERAAKACADWLRAHLAPAAELVILCGNGNNGGDGLAVARLLREEPHFDVHVFTFPLSSKDSEDFSKNLSRLRNVPGVQLHECKDAAPFKNFQLDPRRHVIVDALFGSGLGRAPEGAAAEIISQVNASRCEVIAIDVPSGLFGDDNSANDRKHVIRATATLTFQSPKLAFLFAENAPFTGDFHVLDIGLHPEFLAQAKTPHHFITADMIAAIYRPRPKFAHKGTFGHALLVCGSRGKMGAGVLAASACLSSGVGLLTVLVPRCGYEILQTAVPAAMTIESEEESIISGKIPNGFQAVGMGPGIGTEKATEQALKQLIQERNAPLVLDADALNILAENKTWLAFLHEEIILTPHPGEFDRLTEKHNSGHARLTSQQAFARRFGVHVVLKGAHTSIACPDGTVYFNSTGNPGMATGGSGDVLTGIITALRAQGYGAREACILGVWLHGVGGDLHRQYHSEESLTATELVRNLGEAFRYAAGLGNDSRLLRKQ